jgi:gliding motility-associated lipoprotein GldH
MKILFFFNAAIILFTSCDNKLIYGKDLDIGYQGWHQDSIFTFVTDSLTDLPPILTIGFNIRNTTDYKFRNLYLFVEINIPGRDKPIKDTIDHLLMTPDGYWTEGVVGASIKESMVYLKDSDVDLKESIAYYPYAIQNPEKGIYRIKIQQGMRDSILEDVVSIGTRIEKIDF